MQRELNGALASEIAEAETLHCGGKVVARPAQFPSAEPQQPFVGRFVKEGSHVFRD